MAKPIQSGRIHFHYQSAPFYFPGRTGIKTFLASIFRKEGKALQDLSYVFCTDEFLLNLNQQFLKHDTLTDIISFELSPKGEDVEGEIYISIDRIRENASAFRTSFINELHRVMIHGALHLCGYKDKSKKEQELMRAMENKYLGLLNVSRGT